MTSLVSENGPSVTVILPLASRTRTPSLLGSSSRRGLAHPFRGFDLAVVVLVHLVEELFLELHELLARHISLLVRVDHVHDLHRLHPGEVRPGARLVGARRR